MGGQRYFYLDVISGVFIVQIIVMHVLQFSGLYNAGTAFDAWDSVLFFYMPWFYFKSGLFICRSGNTKERIRRDIYRLIVPYVIFTAIGSAVYACFDLYEGTKPLWKILLAPLWGVVKVGSAGGNLPLWFLLSLFWTRMLFYVMPERFERPAAVVALFCGLALNKMNILLPFSLSTVFPGFIFLLLGKWCKNWLFDDEKLKTVIGGVRYGFFS